MNNEARKAHLVGSGIANLVALRNLISASILLLSMAPPALAGSVTQPGDTMVLPVARRSLRVSIFANQLNWGSADTSPETRVLTEIPIFALVRGIRPVS